MNMSLQENYDLSKTKKIKTQIKKKEKETKKTCMKPNGNILPLKRIKIFMKNKHIT